LSKLEHDVIIVGGGPAGLSAAINVQARGRSALVITNDYRENPLYKAQQVDNYLGMPGQSGPELMEAFWAQAQSSGAELRSGRVTNILPMGGKCYLNLGGEMLEAGAVVLATGVARGKKFPGEEEHLGRGVSYCATCDGMLYRNKRVAVVGLSPQAPEEAEFLLQLGCQVTYLSAQRPQDLNPAIPWRPMQGLEILGQGAVSALRAGGEELLVDGVFILRSTLAPTDLVSGLELEEGYIKVDRSMGTNLPGIFAAGDCTGLPLQIAKAVGEGMVAGQRAADSLRR
jgi:thioredoxin reductase (NADPH)